MAVVFSRFFWGGKKNTTNRKKLFEVQTAFFWVKVRHPHPSSRVLGKPMCKFHKAPQGKKTLTFFSKVRGVRRLIRKNRRFTTHGKKNTHILSFKGRFSVFPLHQNCITTHEKSRFSNAVFSCSDRKEVGYVFFFILRSMSIFNFFYRRKKR